MNLEELIAASQEIVNDTEPPLTSAVALHPETTDSQLNVRKVKNATSREHLNSETGSNQPGHYASSPASMSSSTTQTTTVIEHDHDVSSTVTNGVIPNTSNAVPNSNHGSVPPPLTTTRTEKKAHRERAERDLPTGPPTDILHDPGRDAFSPSTHSWPIVIAIVPPMAALVYGQSDVWSDFLLLLLIAYYLYNIIKVPWELYYAARSRRVVNEKNTAEEPFDPAHQIRRDQAARELRQQELLALLLVVASPIIGGYVLHYAKLCLTDYDKYISNFNIVLFVFASGIRPLTHVAMLIKNRTLHLQEQVHYPSTEVELLKRRVQHLEYEIAQLRKGVATKRDVSSLRDGFEPTITQLNKAVRRYERKEQYLRNYSEERFTYLEAKLRDYDNFITYKLQEEQAMSLPRSAIQMMFLPLNVTFTLLGYARHMLPKSKPLLQPAGATSDDEEDAVNNNYRDGGDLHHHESYTAVGKELQKY